MEVRNEYGKSRVVVVNVGQDDVDGMLINWDLTDNDQYDYIKNSKFKKSTERVYDGKEQMV